MNNRVTHFEIPSDKMVDNIASSMKAIEKAGGKIVVPKRPVATIGWLAFFADSDENVHGVWEEDKEAK